MAVQRISTNPLRRWAGAPGVFVMNRIFIVDGKPQIFADLTVDRHESNRILAQNWLSSVVGITGGGIHDEGYSMATTQEQLDEAAQEVEAAYTRFATVRDKMKGSLKNDTVAASAAAAKIRAEMEKIADSVRASMDVLLSDDMVRAVEQAERLATALRAISELRTTKLSLALFDTSPAQSEKT